jgi:hypothetical protein
MTAEQTTAYQQALWRGLDRVLDAAPPDANLHVHGLGPLAAWRLRERGLPIPEALEEISRRSAYGTVTAAPMLERIRATIDGPIVLLKGPEVAALYPQPVLRPYGDLDLLVENPARAESRLVAAGFDLVGPADRVVPEHHHDRPLRLKGLALAVELHRAPGWLSWQRRPSNPEVFLRAVPSVTGVGGVSAMPPADRALHLAAHSWRHGPYHSWVHLIDIALARETADPEEVTRLARPWGLTGVWEATCRAIDALFFDGGAWPSGIDRLWSRHLLAVRERTLIEYYAAFWLKGLAAPTLSDKAGAIFTDIRFSFTTHPWQTRGAKLKRIGQAFMRAGRPASEHRFR